MSGDWMEILTAPQREGLSITEVCRRYGIARKTFYARLARYRAEGEPGLAPRPHRPRASAPRAPREVVDALRDLRAHNPHWGARRIRAELQQRGLSQVPAASTIHQILVREGLVTAGTRRRVDTHGTISYRGRRIQLGAAARGRIVVIEEHQDHVRVFGDGALLREVALGPTGAYCGNGKKPTGRPRTSGD
ncbi:MAG TPA: helix-turn-helix domain-containing protein [Pseudonocardia sp.]|nr:helix-turn-helix domain-containing protein [Pseudonocardia sp.]